MACNRRIGGGGGGGGEVLDDGGGGGGGARSEELTIPSAPFLSLPETRMVASIIQCLWLNAFFVHTQPEGKSSGHARSRKDPNARRVSTLYKMLTSGVSAYLFCS